MCGGRGEGAYQHTLTQTHANATHPRKHNTTQGYEPVPGPSTAAAAGGGYITYATYDPYAHVHPPPHPGAYGHTHAHLVPPTAAHYPHHYYDGATASGGYAPPPPPTAQPSYAHPHHAHPAAAAAPASAYRGGGGRPYQGGPRGGGGYGKGGGRGYGGRQQQGQGQQQGPAEDGYGAVEQQMGRLQLSTAGGNDEPAEPGSSRTPPPRTVSPVTPRSAGRGGGGGNGNGNGNGGGRSRGGSAQASPIASPRR